MAGGGGAAGGCRGAQGQGGRRGVESVRPPLGEVLGGGAQGGRGCAGRSGGVFLLLDDEPEVAAVCIYPAGRGFGSGAGRGRSRRREGGREGDGEASAQPLSRSDMSSVVSSCSRAGRCRTG